MGWAASGSQRCSVNARGTLRARAMLTVRLDGRSIEASPGGFVHALADALGLGDPDAALERLSNEPAIVLTIDSYDSLTPLDPWLRESFLPRLPSRGVVVIAGRKPPPVDWTSDPALGTIFRALPLKNLPDNESRALLSRAWGAGGSARRRAAVHPRPSAGARAGGGCHRERRPRCGVQPRERPGRRPRASRPADRIGTDPATSQGARDVRPRACHDRSAARRRHRRRSARAVRVAVRAVFHRARRRGTVPARPGARSARR